jgi:methenyltetrahydrofolate cyclohydrolase
VEDPADNLTDLSVRELNELLASRQPIPGGGSAAALAGAMGASLVAMVAELTIGRPDAADHAAQLVSLRDDALAAQRHLLDLAEQDAAAYAAVVEARRLPRDSDVQRAERGDAMRRTMVVAADVPLRTARAAAQVLELAEAIAPIGNPNAVSDAGVASLLGAAAVRGAILNVQINLPYLADDEPLRAQAPGELITLESRTAELESSTAEVVRRRIQPS